MRLKNLLRRFLEVRPSVILVMIEFSSSVLKQANLDQKQLKMSTFIKQHANFKSVASYNADLKTADAA